LSKKKRHFSYKRRLKFVDAALVPLIPEFEITFSFSCTLQCPLGVRSVAGKSQVNALTMKTLVDKIFGKE
jgi:hypothetical protein